MTQPTRCRRRRDRLGSEWYAGLALLHFGWACFADVGDIALLRIDPSIVSPEADTPAQIEGRNLQNQVRLTLDDDSPPEIDRLWAVRVGSSDAREVTLLNPSTLSAVIPAGLPPGVYDVTVTAPGGSVFRLPEGLTVRLPDPTSGPNGSVGGASGGGGAGGSGAGTSGGASGSLAGGTPCSEFSTPERLSGFGLAGDLYGPTLSLDGLELLFAQYDGGEAVVAARRSDHGAVFSLATRPAGINGAGNNGTPFLTQDGLTLYFYSDRPGGLGSRDIWQAHRTAPGAAWQNVALVPVINSSRLDHLPTLSADQRTLVFASNRGSLSTDSELWISERSSVSENFSPPQSLALNTPVEDTGPSLSSDGLTLYFGSDRPSGGGNSDIWVATRLDRASSFGPPVKVDPVNSPSDEINVMLSADGLELIFSSNRSGSYQLWRALRSCP